MPPTIHQLPWVTIITVNYNDAQNLQKTIANVKQQDYARLEYIVIDGGSTDTSKEIIIENEEYITHWVSEKDQGTFDAMNKGVMLAKGEYVIFMNAGDWFLSPEVISKVFSLKESTKADLVYGHHEVHYPKFIKKKTALPLYYLWKHMIFSHQALFTRKTLLQKHPFDTSFQIAADYDFIFNCYQSGKKFFNSNIFVAGYLAGGQSELQIIKAYRENKHIVFQHHPKIPIKIFHYWLIAKQYPLVLLRKLLPEKLYLYLMELKNKD